MYKILISPYTEIFFNEWKLDQDRSDYNIVSSQKLDGKLDIARLNSAINHFISDHVIVNSHIEEINGKLYWKKNKSIYELDKFEDKLTQLDIISYVKKPFIINRGPLYRFGLIKNCDHGYRLIIVLHHILIDSLSVNYFFEELSKYYNLDGIAKT